MTILKISKFFPVCRLLAHDTVPLSRVNNYLLLKDTCMENNHQRQKGLLSPSSFPSVRWGPVFLNTPPPPHPNATPFLGQVLQAPPSTLSCPTLLTLYSKNILAEICIKRKGRGGGVLASFEVLKHLSRAWNHWRETPQGILMMSAWVLSRVVLHEL